MRLIIEPELKALMEKRGKHTIAVEVASSDGSDFEVQELHVHLVSDRDAAALITRKHFHPRDAEGGGRVLLPNYRLEYDETVIFGVKRLLCFRLVSCRGIRF